MVRQSDPMGVVGRWSINLGGITQDRRRIVGALAQSKSSARSGVRIEALQHKAVYIES